MAIPEGHKQTEVGSIPNDWLLKRLSELGSLKKGRGIKKDEVQPDGFPCVRYGELYTHHNEYIKTINSFITQETAKASQRISKGDILFAGSGETKEEIGKCAAYLGEDEAFAGGDLIILSPKKADPLFLGFILNQSIVKRQKAQIGQGDAVVHIYPSGIANIKIPIPPTLAEQTAIATALSDMDALISSLEKLIAKKRLIKQGAMQQLLRPKEGWVRRKLGEVAEIIMGQSPLSEHYNDKGIGLPLVQGNADIENRETIIRFYTSEITKRGKKGDFIITVRAPVGEVSRAKFDCCLGRGVCAIRYPNDYLYHYLISIENQWSRLSSGSTFDSITSNQLREIEIYLPGSLSEQSAIGNALNDFDKDILCTESKLTKAQIIKQGMMQNLLTGKIRLV